MKHLNINRLNATLLFVTGLFTPLANTFTHAQSSYPSKPIKLIIGFPAGGPLDQHARLWAERVQQLLGATIVIDCKAGAGGAIGAEAVAKSPADGYTLLLANTGTMVINPALYKKLPYDTLKDFAPIARTAQQPLAFLVNSNVPAKTLSELVSHVKKNPGKLNYGSAGNGGISHLVPEMFKQSQHLFMVHIPYRGSAPAMTDLIAGQVQFMAESVPLAAQYHKQGKVRALAVTSRERNAALPDVPTVMESGISGLNHFEVVGFYGVLAPAGTPKDVVSKLSAAFEQTLNTPDIKTRMVTQGADPAFMGSEAFTKFLDSELQRWSKAVKASGATLD
jgi:tripartite-type tricarboxylate transporter receptor subunit TctC